MSDQIKINQKDTNDMTYEKNDKTKIWPFIVKCLILLFLLFIFCFKVIMPQYLGNYQASTIDKMKLLKETKGPKIVLIGNSNLAFGIDSELIEKEMGMPVVNMGVHGGVGNAFNEQAAYVNVEPGDIYVVCETNYNDNDTIKNQKLAWITIENHYELYRYIRPKDWPGMIKAYPTYLKDCLTKWRTETGNQETNDAYRRSAFNSYGDDYYPRTTGEDIDFSLVTINPISDVCQKRLNTMTAKIREKGADVVIAAYPIANYENAPSKEKYRNFTNELADKLDAVVISDFSAYMYDTDLFYDNHTHLTTEGVQVRTRQLIEDLKKYRMAGE